MFVPELLPIISLNPIMTPVRSNFSVSKSIVMPMKANLFGEVYKSVVRATLVSFNCPITLSLDSIKVFINLSFTWVLLNGLYNGCKLATNNLNACSSPKVKGWLFDTRNCRKNLCDSSISN